jgi:hypothetical protein
MIGSERERDEVESRRRGLQVERPALHQIPFTRFLPVLSIDNRDVTAAFYLS